MLPNTYQSSNGDTATKDTARKRTAIKRSDVNPNAIPYEQFKSLKQAEAVFGGHIAYVGPCQSDVTEMALWIRKEGLFSDAQLAAGIAQVAVQMAESSATHIESINDSVGDNFLHKLDSCLEQFGPDIVVINPYTAFLGGDVKDEALANRFLREGLTPMLTKHECAAIILHHTPKTQFSKTDDFTTADFMYRGSGCASMTNWSRAYIVFEPVKDNESTFRFVAAKRWQRIGWGGKVRYFKHSDNGELRWVPCSTEEATALETERKSRSNVRKQIDPESVLKYVPMLDAERLDAVIRKVSDGLNIGINRAKTELDGD